MDDYTAPVSPLKAIQTRYKGCHFRSRLEARWAVFFDALEIAWEYEPEGYVLEDGTWYLPDFFLPQVDMFAEVKPENGFSLEDCEKCRLLAHGTRREVLMCEGTPSLREYYAQRSVDDYAPPYIAYDLLDANRYHLSEGRFYSIDFSDGFTTNGRLWDGGAHEAVDAARSARFEHGESGAS